MRYRLSPLAELDMKELWAYVAGEASEERADRLVDAVAGAVDMLARHPRAGRLRPEFGDAVRSYPVAGYVIYYRVTDILLVARVLHGRRDQVAAWHLTDEQE